MKKVVVLSTDKAAYPVNVMGMTKALMEKVMVAKARNLDSSKTIFVELDMEMLWDQGALLFLYL